MGMYSFFQNCFGFAMVYGVSELLAKLQWKASFSCTQPPSWIARILTLTPLQIYFIFIGIDAVCVYVTWKLFPEFLYFSLEDIDLVFASPGVHPVKMSKRLYQAKLQKRKEDREQQVTQE